MTPAGRYTNPRGATPSQTRGYLQWLGVGGLFAAGLLALLAAALVLDCAERLRSARAWVEHTNTVLTTIADLRASLLTGGVARRSFIITGDSYYLNEFTNQRAAATTQFDRLSALVADNAAQEKRISVLRREIVQVWSAFDTQLKTSGLAAIAASMRGARGLSLYKQISSPTSAQFETIRGTETALLANRERATDTAQFWLLTYAAVSVALAVLAAALGAYLLLHQRIVSQARELELEMQHMQRLGIMNQTSSVLAHEILHPLTAAQNYAGILNGLFEGEVQRSTPSPLPIVEKLEGQIRRAADIVKRLRGFIGRSDSLREAERIETLIDDAAGLFEVVDRSAELEVNIADNLPEVLVERVQIRQVMVNLMRNAAEAMRGCDQRKLTISAASISPRQVEIRFDDSGKGISPDIAGQLFEPFVGDKSDGMGLGLSISRSIVVAHGGRIWAERSPSGGASFCFTLPAVPAGWPGSRTAADACASVTAANTADNHSGVAEETATAMRTSS